MLGESYAFLAAPIFSYTICIQLILKEKHFWHFSENTFVFRESVSLGSLLNQSRTYQGWNLVTCTLDLSPSLEVASSDSLTCTKRSAPNKDHIIDSCMFSWNLLRGFVPHDVITCSMLLTKWISEWLYALMCDEYCDEIYCGNSMSWITLRRDKLKWFWK